MHLRLAVTKDAGTVAQLFHDAIRALSAGDYGSEQVVAWASALLHQIHASADRLGLPRLYTEASITARPVFEKQVFAWWNRKTSA